MCKKNWKVGLKIRNVCTGKEGGGQISDFNFDQTLFLEKSGSRKQIQLRILSLG